MPLSSWPRSCREPACTSCPNRFPCRWTATWKHVRRRMSIHFFLLTVKLLIAKQEVCLVDTLTSWPRKPRQGMQPVRLQCSRVCRGLRRWLKAQERSCKSNFFFGNASRIPDVHLHPTASSPIFLLKRPAASFAWGSARRPRLGMERARNGWRRCH